MSKNNIWLDFLHEVSIKNYNEILSGFAELRDNYHPSVYYNNLGVLFDASGNGGIAKLFYLKSLGHNSFRYDVWKNFLENKSSTLSEFGLVIYFAQSEVFIKVLLFLLLVGILRFIFQYKQGVFNYKKLKKRLIISLIFVSTFIFINIQQYFVATNKKAIVHSGPSKIFATELKTKIGGLYICYKKNNGFVKLIDFRNLSNPFWVPQETVFKL